MLHSDGHSNKTLFGIQNNAARYAWAGYHTFVFLSSLLGDTTILVASIKYKAIKLNKLLVIIMQHIAVCDILTCLSTVLFKTISLLNDGWVMGRWLCHVQAYFRDYITVVAAYLVCAMTTTKLLTLQYPLRARSLTSKSAHVGCTAVWVAIVSLPATMHFVNGSHVTFDFIVFDCHFNIFSSAWNWIMPTVVVLSFVVPTTLVVISTAYLIYVAYRIAVRGRETLKWQGLTTTILTATVYCMSVLPTAAGCIIGSRAGNLNSSFQLHFYRVAVSCQTLNTISNIYIYCLTVTSFRQFLWSQIRFMYSYRTNISLRPNQGPR